MKLKKIIQFGLLIPSISLTVRPLQEGAHVSKGANQTIIDTLSASKNRISPIHENIILDGVSKPKKNESLSTKKDLKIRPKEGTLYKHRPLADPRVSKQVLAQREGARGRKAVQSLKDYEWDDYGLHNEGFIEGENPMGSSKEDNQAYKQYLEGIKEERAARKGNNQKPLDLRNLFKEEKQSKESVDLRPLFKSAESTEPKNPVDLRNLFKEEKSTTTMVELEPKNLSNLFYEPSQAELDLLSQARQPRSVSSSASSLKYMYDQQMEQMRSDKSNHQKREALKTEQAQEKEAQLLKNLPAVQPFAQSSLLRKFVVDPFIGTLKGTPLGGNLQTTKEMAFEQKERDEKAKFDSSFARQPLIPERPSYDVNLSVANKTILNGDNGNSKTDKMIPL